MLKFGNTPRLMTSLHPDSLGMGQRNDVELVVGDPTRLHLTTGFRPQVSLLETVKSVVGSLMGDGRHPG